MSKQTNGKKDALAAPQASSALAGMPEYLRKAPGEQRLGNENVNSSDVTVPRLVLCQSMSPERKKGNAKYIAGLEEGDWFNSVTHEVYGRELRVIPAHYYKSRILWAGEKGELGGGMKCSSLDAITGAGDPGGACAQCSFSQFGSDCNLFMNFPCLVIAKDGSVDLSKIVIASFKSLALKAGKHWNTLVNIRNADRFAGVYKITSVEDHRESGDSFQPHVDNDGWSTKSQYQAGLTAYELISNWQNAGRLNVEQDSGSEEV